MTFFRLGIGALLVAGCSFKPTNVPSGTQGEPQAGFLLDKISLNHVEPLRAVDGAPCEKLYHVQTIVRDRATQQPIVGQTFTLERDGQAVGLSPTDGQGLLHWTEDLSFAPAAPRGYFVARTGTISTQGESVPFEVGINPWKEGAEGFVDLRSTPKKIEVLSGESALRALQGLSVLPHRQAEQQPLIVDHVSLNPTARETDRITYAFAADLQSRRLDQTVDPDQPLPVPVPLPKGRFQAQLKVFQTLGAQTTLIGYSEPFAIEIGGKPGRAEGAVTVFFVHPRHRDANLGVYFEISPSASMLAKAEGLLKLPKDLGALSEGPHSDQSIVEQMREAPLKAQPLAQPGFYIKGSEGAYRGATASGGYRMTSHFSAELNVYDSITNLAIEEPHFEYLVSDTKEWPPGVPGTPSRSDKPGKVVVEGSLDYNDIEDEKVIHKYLLARGLVAPYKGIVRYTEVDINPAARIDSLFYIDNTNGAYPYQMPETPQAQLLISDYSAVFKGHRFQVNDFLQRSDSRLWNLTLKPSLSRSNSAFNDEPQPLRTGHRFKLSVLLIDPYCDKNSPERYLAGFETVAEVNKSKLISVPIAFVTDFSQQHRLDSRTQIQVRLEPLDNSRTAPAYLTAAFTANPNGNDISLGYNLDPSEAAFTGIPLERTRSIQTEGGTAYALKIEWSSTPLELYTRYWRGFGPLVTIAQAERPEGWEAWDSWMEKHPKLRSRLKDLGAFVRSEGGKTQQLAPTLLTLFCEINRSFLTPDEQKACRRDATGFFHVSHFKIVEKNLSPHPKKYELMRWLTPVSASFFNEQQVASRTIEADKTSDHWTWGLYAKLAYELFGSGGGVQTTYNHEKEAYELVEASVSDSTRSRMSASQIVSFTQEKISMTLNLKLRRCALVRPIVFQLLASESLGSSIPSYLICTEPQEEKTKESWYAIHDNWTPVHSANSDIKDPQERGWTKFIRGDAAFEEFDKSIRDETRAYVFKRIDPYIAAVDDLVSAVFDSHRQRANFSIDGGVFPGVLAHYESMRVQWRQPEIQEATGRCIKLFSRETGNSKSALEWANRYCRCYFESTARRWPLKEYLDNRAAYDQRLEQSGVADRCEAFAQAGDKP